MNDRLKFRVWDKGNKRYQGTQDWQPYLDTDGDVCFINTDDVRDYPPENYFIIEQCTGLKDKNGNLIYEGDIVRGAENTVGTVKFGKHGYDPINVGFYIQWDMKYPWRYDIGYWTAPENPDCIEIIGNIHEQAEQKD